MMSDREDLVLIQKINALQKVNSEIINRIEEKLQQNVEVVRSRTYKIVFDYFGANSRLEETKTTLSAKSIVSQWNPENRIKKKLTMTKEMNFFNDNINYECTSFVNIKHLNQSMSDVAVKFGWLDPTKSPPVLRNFLTNFEVLQIYLGDLEENLMDSKVMCDGLHDKLKKLNLLAKEVIQEMKDINSQVLLLDTKTIQGEMTVSQDEKTLTKTVVGHSCISCSEGYSKGTQKWDVVHLGAIAKQGWLLLGVHANPKSATTTTYSDTAFYGVNVNVEGFDNNGCWSGGIYTKVSTLRVVNGTVIHVQLHCDAKTLTVSTSKWNQMISLPTTGPWYPHFYSYDASFSLK